MCIRIVLTVYNDNPPVSQFFLMNRLGVHQTLVEESTECGSLVEANHTVISLDLFE